jgi:hypothetical protein
VFLVNSRYPLVCATHLSSESKSHHQSRSSFFRSYGGNLPSSLTIVLPLALVFSTRPPVSVWGTGSMPTHCWAFLGSIESVTSQYVARHHVSALTLPTLIGNRLHAYPGTTIARVHLSSCVPRQLSARRSVRSLNIKMNSPNVATIGLGAGMEVLEYQPVVHRLRLSASP